MRDLAAEPPREAAEVPADLQRCEIALVNKNSFVLIGTSYDYLLMDVFFLQAILLFGITGTRGTGFRIQFFRSFQVR